MPRIKDQTKTISLSLTDKFVLDRDDPNETFSVDFSDLKNQIINIEENDIGIAGQAGFGVGICPASILPNYLIGMTGYTNRASGNYGNYVCTTDGSVMCWIPAFVFKISNDTAAPYYGNKTLVKSFKDYGYSIDSAAADGYALHRAFIDGGQIKKGVFVDKYKWSLTNFENNVSGIASSIKNGNPISSGSDSLRDATNNFAGAFSNCKSNSQSPSNTYGGAWAAAKSRGNDFAVISIFIRSALSLLSLAHGQASTSSTFNAWYDATGVMNFPKGNNNYGADVNNAAVTFAACDDAFWASRNEARKNGSASVFAKTTHNGQNCGISDLQGNQWEIVQGLTCIASSKSITAITRAAEAVFTINNHGYTNNDLIFVEGSAATEWTNLLQYRFYNIEVIDLNTFKLKKKTNDADNGNYLNSAALASDYTSGLSIVKGTFYILKENTVLKNVNGGSGGANDHFSNATLFDVIDLSAVLINSYTSDRFGNSTNQVLGFSTDKASNNYRLTALGIPNAANSISTSGSNQFGADMFYKFIRNEMCPRLGGFWAYGTFAGLWDLYLNDYRPGSNRSVGGRSCLYV
jgi:hypothetical protein